MCRPLVQTYGADPWCRPMLQAEPASPSTCDAHVYVILDYSNKGAEVQTVVSYGSYLSSSMHYGRVYIKIKSNPSATTFCYITIVDSQAPLKIKDWLALRTSLVQKIVPEFPRDFSGKMARCLLMGMVLPWVCLPASTTGLDVGYSTVNLCQILCYQDAVCSASLKAASLKGHKLFVDSGEHAEDTGSILTLDDYVFLLSLQIRCTADC